MVLSTLHEYGTIPSSYKKDQKILENVKKKPNTIFSYNSTKCGVDSLDQMNKCYNVKAPSRRWPIQVWNNILNLASINAWIIYKEVNKSMITRQKFSINLIQEIHGLIKPTTCSTSNQLTPSSTISTPLSTFSSSSSQRTLSLTNQTMNKRKLLIRPTVHQNIAKYVCVIITNV